LSFWRVNRNHHQKVITPIITVEQRPHRGPLLSHCLVFCVIVSCLLAPLLPLFGTCACVSSGLCKGKAALPRDALRPPLPFTAHE